jgi:nucleoside diphosphate kinase
MAKKKRSEYTKQRERIKKVYKRIEEKGYKLIDSFNLKTTKELLAEGTDPESYARLLSRMKTKDIKKGLKVLDPETGIIFDYSNLKEYEKEKVSEDNIASFYDWLRSVLDNAILPEGLTMLTGKTWIDGGVLQEEYDRFRNTMYSQIDKDEKEDAISLEIKEEITSTVNGLLEVPYYEMFHESIITLTNLILNRPLTVEESTFISDRSDFVNGGTSV